MKDRPVTSLRNLTTALTMAATPQMLPTGAVSGEDEPRNVKMKQTEAIR